MAAGGPLEGTRPLLALWVAQGRWWAWVVGSTADPLEGNASIATPNTWGAAHGGHAAAAGHLIGMQSLEDLWRAMLE